MLPRTPTTRGTVVDRTAVDLAACTMTVVPFCYSASTDPPTPNQIKWPLSRCLLLASTPHSAAPRGCAKFIGRLVWRRRVAEDMQYRPGDCSSPKFQ